MDPVDSEGLDVGDARELSSAESARGDALGSDDDADEDAEHEAEPDTDSDLENVDPELVSQRLFAEVRNSPDSRRR